MHKTILITVQTPIGVLVKQETPVSGAIFLNA